MKKARAMKMVSFMLLSFLTIGTVLVVDVGSAFAANFYCDCADIDAKQCKTLMTIYTCGGPYSSFASCLANCF